MCGIRYILCTLFCICTCSHVAATCCDSISGKFSYQILENFNYCRDNNTIHDTCNPKDTTSFISFHKYIISPVFNAFSNNVNEQFELDKIGYSCKHYHIKAKNYKNAQYYSMEINILSDVKNYAPVTTKLEELKKQEYAIVDIISEAPVMCLVFMEGDYLIAVTYNLFYDFDDILSISKSFAKQHIPTKFHLNNQLIINHGSSYKNSYPINN